jgi:hypothetical protein
MTRIIFLLPFLIYACTSEPTQTEVVSKEDRLALFDEIYTKTLAREAFSPIKEQNLGIDVKEEMQKVREDFVNATTGEDLYFAIHKMSCARKDRHLSISQVEGGLTLPEAPGGVAPIRFLPDFSSEQIKVFVSDVTSDIQNYIPAETSIAPGDLLVKVNNRTVAQYYQDAEPYVRYSTVNDLKMNFAGLLGLKQSAYLPSSFYGDSLELELSRGDGSVYTVSLPYLQEDQLHFVVAAKHKYPGYRKAFEKQTYHLYLPEDPNNTSLVLWWYGFRENLQADMDHLIAYADSMKLLDYDLIIDLTDSRGGSRGVYAIQRLSPKTFKTTFGNIRLSDMAADFVDRREKAYAKSQAFMDGTEKETDDDGTWLINWLRADVVPRMEAGEDYSSNVPFKCAHAPHTSDGMIPPAEKHFTGRLVCFFGPQGGSHLDQFSAIVNDNDLGHSIGMPTGGYSNTWEGDEILKFPISGKPAVEYMWSLGHTIRPNGEIMEGNPASVDEYIPLTRENFEDYVPKLLEQAQQVLNGEE